MAVNGESELVNAVNRSNPGDIKRRWCSTQRGYGAHRGYQFVFRVQVSWLEKEAFDAYLVSGGKRELSFHQPIRKCPFFRWSFRDCFRDVAGDDMMDPAFLVPATKAHRAVIPGTTRRSHATATANGTLRKGRRYTNSSSSQPMT